MASAPALRARSVGTTDLASERGVATSRYSKDDIRVWDELVPKPLQQSITDLVRRPIWQYGWQSNNKLNRYCHWHAHFAGGGINSRKSCELELAQKPELAPINDLWQLLLRGPLAGHEPLRVYANSHTYGIEGYVHTDNDDTENYFSTIYFAHEIWHKNWSGETVFYTEGGDEIISSVYPKPGRLVSFFGAIPHCARAPSRDCVELRVSVVIKTQLRSREPKP
jgi:SM-20-related protein